jgi:hypothetical protein
MRLKIAPAIAGVLLLAGARCTSIPRRTYSDFPKPFVFVRQLSEFPMPDAPEQYHTGPIAVLWDDGTVLQATSDKNIGRRYTLGHVTPQQVKAVELFIGESGLWDREPGGTIREHDPERQVCVHKGGTVRVWMENYPDNQEAVISQLIDMLRGLQPSNPEAVRWHEVYPAGWCE